MRPTDVLAHRRVIYDRLQSLPRAAPSDPIERMLHDAMVDWRIHAGTSEAYYVSADMTAVAKSAARTMPSQILRLGDVPTPSGFLVFDTPIGTWPEGETHHPVSGFMWQEADNAPVWDVNGTPVKWGANTARWAFGAEIPPELADYPGIADLGPPQGTYDRTPDRHERWVGIYPLLQRPDLLPGLIWPEATRDGPVEWVYTCPPTNDEGGVLNVLRAAWTIMQQFLTVSMRTGVDRAESRRSARLGLIPEVVVIRLRRKSLDDKDKDPDGNGVEWSHRWLVSGHWRNQWLPSRSCHRLQWISGYVKGPDNKPLIVKDKVTAWVQ
jgi:hypothetical protein